ncbi:MAG: PASTA domain-containing protein [Clostridia bacterium]|nr:PASTA domain-containing protein [Clostridia bacterium]
MATAVSTIANGGTYIQPRILKQIVNSETGEITEIEPIKKDKVISEETSKKILSMMESVVSEGTGKNAQVKGYSIGGKTGTSEDGVNTNKYVASFVGVTPISNPQLVVLVVLYNPTGEGGHGGGGVAAPVASNILNEVLPYLEVSQDNMSSDDIRVNVEVPNVVGLSYKEAKSLLQDVGLQITMRNEQDEKEIPEDFIISNQVPSSAVQILEGGSVIVE